MAKLSSLCVMIAALMISGCTNGVSNLALISPAGANGSIEKLLVVTNRKPSSDLSIRFNGDRNDRLSFADIGIWVPQDRVAGEMRYPYTTIDPNRHFAAVAYEDIHSESEFLKRLNEKLGAIEDPEQRRVIVYTHGYNVDFGEGVLRHAQITHDFGIEGAAVHFSWPSAGELSRYLYDRDSANYSRDALAMTLELVARSDAESVMVFAHSMGTFLTMETLRQISLEKRTDILERIDTLVLASPDIDMDVFRSQLASVSPIPVNMITLVSKRDTALTVSERLRGGHDTVGRGDQINELQALGLAVVDMTSLEDSFTTAHNGFAESPTLLRLIADGSLGKLIEGADSDQARDSGVGALSDLAASIIYLPARIMGER